jgi:hypothetical protein
MRGRRHGEIAAPIGAYNEASPRAPLPRNAAWLFSAMLPFEDVRQRSLEAIAAEGFRFRILPWTLGRLVAAGLLSRHRVAGAPDTYRRHLLPRGGSHEA